MNLFGESSHERIRHDFPYDIKKLTQISIPVDENVQLAATIWMPQSFISFHGVK